MYAEANGNYGLRSEKKILCMHMPFQLNNITGKQNEFIYIFPYGMKPTEQRVG